MVKQRRDEKKFVNRLNHAVISLRPNQETDWYKREKCKRNCNVDQVIKLGSNEGGGVGGGSANPDQKAK